MKLRASVVLFCMFCGACNVFLASQIVVRTRNQLTQMGRNATVFTSMVIPQNHAINVQGESHLPVSPDVFHRVIHTPANPYLIAQSDSVDNTANPLIISGIVAGTAAAVGVSHGLLNSLWWKGEAVPFHINWEQDWVYARGADKVGHFVFSSMATTAYEKLYGAAGLDSVSSVIWAAATVFTYQTYIEIRDGFSRDYGFSVADEVCNLLGVGFPIARRLVPEARPFQFQISYWPSDDFRKGAYGAIIDDYTSTTHWLAVNISDVLPRSWEIDFPQWLGIAVGHSVDNLDGRGGGRHVWYLSLDWQPARIHGLPQWLRDVLDVLHVYHLPAPAVRIAPDVRWFGLRF